MRPERERVKALLTEAVTLLCKNSVTYQQEVEVEGLLGITVDKNEVFLVSLHELISKEPTGKSVQLNSPQFASTPSYSPTASKRKRRRKSGDGTPQVPTKKMTPTASTLSSADGSNAIILADDDASNEMGDFQESADSARIRNDQCIDSSQGPGEPISDTTFDDEFQDSTAFQDQSALASSKTDNSQSSVPRVPGQLSEEPFGANDNETPGASDSLVSVKQEKLDSFHQQEDDSLVGGEGYDGFEQEQKWSATMGMMHQGEGSPGMIGSATFGLSPGTSGQQSNAQNFHENVRKKSKVAQRVRVPQPSRKGKPKMCPIPQCGLEFSDVMGLFNHQLKRNHFDDFCYMCNTSFISERNLKRHVDSVHSKSVYKCWMCDKVYNRQDNLKVHQFKVHGMAVCRYCQAAFRDKQSLRIHVGQSCPEKQY